MTHRSAFSRGLAPCDDSLVFDGVRRLSTAYRHQSRHRPGGWVLGIPSPMRHPGHAGAYRPGFEEHSEDERFAGKAASAFSSEHGERALDGLWRRRPRIARARGNIGPRGAIKKAGS